MHDRVFMTGRQGRARLLPSRPGRAPICSPARREVPRLARKPRWAAVTALLLGSALVAAAGGPDEVAARLDQRLARLPRGTEIGLMVADCGRDETWYASEVDRPLKPASVQKLLVTAVALERFGPDFRYRTELYLRDGELWIVGGGDPGLGDERLAARGGRDAQAVLTDWSAALRSRGVAAVHRIVLDDGVFDTQFRHPDWPASQADRWYQAPVGGLNLNDNCLDVKVQVSGRNVTLQLRPDIPLNLIDNTLRVDRRQRITLKRPADSDTIQLRGTVSRSGELDPVAVRDPTLFFAQSLKHALERGGIAVQGPVVRRHLTPEELAAAERVAAQETPLPDVLWRCNTFSQNLFAECLLKSLAAYGPGGVRRDTPGSWDEGVAALETGLRELGVDLDGAVLRDGSGLSHANRATARQLVTLLLRMRRHPHADVFLASLAEPGQEGSMRNRYDDPALRGRLRAKTGTIAGVRALAGYATRPDGTTLAFAILVNGANNDDLPLEICKLLLAPGGR